MRILVTGAGGMLGSALVPALARAGHQLVVTDLDLHDRRPWGEHGPTLCRLDVRAAADVETAVAAVRPDLVAHLAALTDLELCEEHPDAALHTNALGTKHVALACQRHEVPMAYISTAGVFDGEHDDAYTEFDEPNPINVYGRSKFEGERFVQRLLHRYYIVRAGWMVGGGAKDHKFVARILLQLAEGATTVYAVGDRIGTPTYAPDFAATFARLVESGSFGLYHMVCEGWATRHDVARRILEILGRDDVELVEVDSEFFRDEFPVPRPPSEALRNLVLELQGANTMRPWEEALEEYVPSALEDLRAAALLGGGPAPVGAAQGA